MDCLAAMVTEAVDDSGKALTAFNDTLHEDEPEMRLKTLTPTMQQEARMIEIRKIENQETFEEVYLDDGVEMTSGK